jgi:hypothetical protein
MPPNAPTPTEFADLGGEPVTGSGFENEPADPQTEPEGDPQ